MTESLKKTQPLKLQVKVDEGLIKVTFSQLVTEIGFTKKEAVTFATSILARIGELKE